MGWPAGRPWRWSPCKRGQTGGRRHLGGRAGAGTGGGGPGAALGCARIALDADRTADGVAQVPGACKRGEATLAAALRRAPRPGLSTPIGASPVLGARAGEIPVRRRRGGDLRDIALLLDTHSRLVLGGQTRQDSGRRSKHLGAMPAVSNRADWETPMPPPPAPARAGHARVERLCSLMGRSPVFVGMAQVAEQPEAHSTPGCTAGWEAGTTRRRCRWIQHRRRKGWQVS